MKFKVGDRVRATAEWHEGRGTEWSAEHRGVVKSDYEHVWVLQDDGEERLWAEAYLELETPSAPATQSKFERIATELGKLVTSKNQSYGNSAETAAKIMALLYPNGISVGQMRDALLVVRILDKLGRISNGARKDSFADIGGYGIVGAAMDEDD